MEFRAEKKTRKGSSFTKPLSKLFQWCFQIMQIFTSIFFISTYLLKYLIAAPLSCPLHISSLLSFHSSRSSHPLSSFLLLAFYCEILFLRAFGLPRYKLATKSENTQLGVSLRSFVTCLRTAVASWHRLWFIKHKDVLNDMQALLVQTGSLTKIERLVSKNML